MRKTKNSKSWITASKTLFACFQILKENGSEMNRSDLIEKIEKTISFNDWEKELLPSNGSPRWITIFLFNTIGCIKGGFLIKVKGTWLLTKEGIEAMKEGADALLSKSISKYNEWAKLNQPENISNPENERNEDDFAEENSSQSINLELLESQALDGIVEHINKMNPYEFQDFVAALLRAMGYYTDFVAERGKDGGIDIIAYQDALGLKTPRIKVQVKHYPKNPIAVDALRSLKGLINAPDEVGLFTTSGSFSSESKRFSRETNVHVKLLDGEALIELWKQFYSKLSDDEKNILPLKPVYFLGSNDYVLNN